MQYLILQAFGLQDQVLHAAGNWGDITKRKADAIGNAARPSLPGGGGVDGASASEKEQARKP